MSQGQPSTEDRQPELWDVCESGELTNMVHRLDVKQRRARRRKALSTAFVSTSAVAFAVVALGTFMNQSNLKYGGLTCLFCRGHFAEFQAHHAGQSVHEDANFIKNMSLHLKDCNPCRDEFNLRYPKTPFASVSAHRMIPIALQPVFTANFSQRLD